MAMHMNTKTAPPKARPRLRRDRAGHPCGTQARNRRVPGRERFVCRRPKARTRSGHELGSRLLETRKALGGQGPSKIAKTANECVSPARVRHAGAARVGLVHMQLNTKPARRFCSPVRVASPPTRYASRTCKGCPVGAPIRASGDDRRSKPTSIPWFPTRKPCSAIANNLPCCYGSATTKTQLVFPMLLERIRGEFVT